MTGHLDADRLATFRAGLLGRRRARRAAAHLASCESCTDLDAQLASLTSVLAAVGPAVTTPPDVAARLDAALAAAAAESPAVHRVRGGHARPARRGLTLSRLSWRVAAPVAAAVAVMGAAVGFGVSQIGGAPATESAAGSAAMSGAAGAAQAGHKPVTPANGVLMPGLAAPSPRIHSNAAVVPASSRAPFSIASTVQMVRSAIYFEPATVRMQVASQLRAIHSLLSRQVAAPPQVAGCVQALTGSTPPALVELAHYSGKPAIMVAVLRGTSYHVWIAPQACTSSGEVLARLDVPDPPTGTTTP
ncbi:MAG TPA: hypothetical protein VKU39_10455 [Streptosporangiaceae bacterium]|nr:hypothetical protein [Streptosporangiaceae bacterium]